VVLQVVTDLLASQELLVHKEFLVYKELLELADHLARMAHRVTRVVLDLVAQRDPLALLDLKGAPDRTDFLERLDSKGLLEDRDYKDQMDNLVLQVLQDHLVHLDL